MLIQMQILEYVVGYHAQYYYDPVCNGRRTIKEFGSNNRLVFCLWIGHALVKNSPYRSSERIFHCGFDLVFLDTSPRAFSLSFWFPNYHFFSCECMMVSGRLLTVVCFASVSN